MTFIKNNYTLLLIVTFGIVVSLFSTSIKTSYQVFFVAMSEDFNLTRGEFALSGTFFMAIFGISSPIVGYIADRIGAKKTIIGGLFFSGILFLLMATFKSFTSFLFLYGVGAAFAYTAISYVSLGVLVDEISSPKAKGFIYALVTNGAALGFVFLAPLWLYLESFFSWRDIYWITGMVFIVPLTVFAIIVMRTVNVDEKLIEKAYEAPIPKRFNQRLEYVFTSANFYFLALGFLGCGVTMAYIDIHLVAQLKDMELSSGFIGLSLAVLGVSEFVGGITAGILCDRYPQRFVLSGFYLLRALAVFILLALPGQIGVLLFAIVFGLSFMGTIVGTSVVSLNIFSKDIKGFAFGFVWLFHQIGAVLSTHFGANLYDIKGNYQMVLLITGFIAVLSAILVLQIRIPPASGKNI
ncbi:MAG: MFS family permease [Candidatus Latescibacterota bacterium]